MTNLLDTGAEACITHLEETTHPLPLQLLLAELHGADPDLLGSREQRKREPEETAYQN